MKNKLVAFITSSRTLHIFSFALTAFNVSSFFIHPLPPLSIVRLYISIVGLLLYIVFLILRFIFSQKKEQ
jgi:hypothetical protein